MLGDVPLSKMEDRYWAIPAEDTSRSVEHNTYNEAGHFFTYEQQRIMGTSQVLIVNVPSTTFALADFPSCEFK